MEDSDNDGYRDSWEIMTAMMEFPKHQFDPSDPSDEYNANNPSGVGYIYEEERCRQLEQTVIGKVNYKDWSFDDGSNSAGFYQGKQW